MRTFSFKIEFSIRSYGEGRSGNSYLFYLRLSFLLVAVMLLVYYLVR